MCVTVNERFYNNGCTFTLAVLLFHYGTSKIGTLTDADRRINVFFMKISYSQGARN